MTETVITIPHQLGRQEARRRIETGLAALLKPLDGIVTLQRQSWTGDRLTLTAKALSQTVNGSLDVEETAIHLRLSLPRLLAAALETLKPALRQRAQILLEKATTR